MNDHTLKLYLLGKPQIILRGQPHRDMLVKAQALLFYLALEPGMHSRATLAALLWSDMPEEKARANLRTAVSRLRPTFNSYLTASRSAIGLSDEAAVWVDAVAFEKKLSGSTTLEKRSALELYQGDLLTDFQLRDAPAFEEWLLIERVRLRQLALDGLEQLAHDTWQQGDAAQALTDFRRLLALDSYREAAHRDVMRLLAAAGDRAAALAQFEQCRQILATELGVEPAPSTLRLYEEIKQGTPSVPRPHSSVPPHNLPAATTSFHGRSAEFAHIRTALTDPGCRLLTLTGLGGVGKTRLAVTAAAQLASDDQGLFKDGLFFVSLHTVTKDEVAVLAIAAALGFMFNGPVSPQQQLFAYLRSRRLLLLLDNLEQLREQAMFLSDLLHAAPEVKLLVTSRERLNLYEEWLLPLEGLPYPKLDDEDDSVDYEAIELFVQRARQINLRFDGAAEAAGVRRLCTLVEGLPLGLELAAAWTPTFSCAAIADSIASLAVTLHNVPPRQRSLAATFDYSWQLLTPKEQTALATLGVFRGGFTLEAATAVTRSTARTLADLMAKSLVRRALSDRYDLHEQVRYFAWQKLDVLEQDRAQRDHCVFFAKFLAARGLAVKTSSQLNMLPLIEIDLENLRVAWSTAIAAGDLESVEQMADPLFHLFSKRGLHREGAAWFETAIAQLALHDQLPEPLLVKLLIRQGRCCELISKEYAIPQELLERGMALARLHDLPEELAHALLGLGLLALIQGQGERSATLLQECADVSQAAQLPWITAHALNLLAWLCNGEGERDQAREMCQQAIAMQEELGDANGMAAALTTLGKIESDVGAYAEAEAAYARALELCRQIRHRVGEAQALTGMFAAAYRQGKFAAATAYAQQSLAVNEDVGNRLGTAVAHHNLGFLFAQQGLHPQAVTQFQETLRIYEQIEADALRRTNTRRYLAESLLALREFDDAAQQLQLALTEISPDTQPERTAELLVTCAAWLLARNRLGQAAEVLRFLQGVTLTEEMQARVREMLTRCGGSKEQSFTSLAEVVAAIKKQLK